MEEMQASNFLRVIALPVIIGYVILPLISPKSYFAFPQRFSGELHYESKKHYLPLQTVLRNISLFLR